MGKYISGMNNKKSSGPDEINNELLKLASPYIAGSLTYNFNFCIVQNVFPWEIQKVKAIPLSKPRDHKHLNDYTQISLVVLSKLLERYVHKHLVTYLETRDLFCPLQSGSLQSGFRRKHSCITTLARLTDSWLSVVNRSDQSGNVFLDFKKRSILLLTKTYS